MAGSAANRQDKANPVFWLATWPGNETPRTSRKKKVLLGM